MTAWTPPRGAASGSLSATGPLLPPPRARHPRLEEIDAGRYADQADVARHRGLTHARLTQLMNLLLLAPASRRRSSPSSTSPAATDHRSDAAAPAREPDLGGPAGAVGEA